MSDRPAVGQQTREALERLVEWANDVTVSAQSHLPIYPNPGALKRDILALAVRVAELETERDEASFGE